MGTYTHGCKLGRTADPDMRAASRRRAKRNAIETARSRFRRCLSYHRPSYRAKYRHATSSTGILIYTELYDRSTNYANRRSYAQVATKSLDSTNFMASIQVVLFFNAVVNCRGCSWLCGFWVNGTETLDRFWLDETSCLGESSLHVPRKVNAKGNIFVSADCECLGKFRFLYNHYFIPLEIESYKYEVTCKVNRDLFHP